MGEFQLTNREGRTHVRDLQRVEDDGRQVALRLGGTRKIRKPLLLKDATESLGRRRPGPTLLLKAKICSAQTIGVDYGEKMQNVCTCRHVSRIQAWLAIIPFSVDLMDTTTLRLSGVSAETTLKELPSARAVSCDVSVTSTIVAGARGVVTVVVEERLFWRTDICERLV